MSALQVRVVFDGFVRRALGGGVSMPLGATSTHRLLVRCRRQIDRWFELVAQRRALAEIADDPHRLADLGLTREAALAESRRRFWQTSPDMYAPGRSRREASRSRPSGSGSRNLRPTRSLPMSR